MPRNPQLPRGHVDVRCRHCGTVYEVFNHENSYRAGESDRCPHCGACDYGRAYCTPPIFWDRFRIRESVGRFFQDPLDRPRREPITDAMAHKYAWEHYQETGEYVTPEEVKKEVNTVYHGFSPKQGGAS